MYLRCNTYTRVKGGYAFAGRGTSTSQPESTYIRSRVSRLAAAAFVAASFVRVRRGRAISPDRPPMGVVPSSNRDYGLRRGRCSPRAPRTRILYLPEKSSGPARLSVRTCVRAHTVCVRKESARYCALARIARRRTALFSLSLPRSLSHAPDLPLSPSREQYRT